jgi:SecD/SecF fusion protein
MTALSPRPFIFVFRQHLWKILLSLALAALACSQLFPLKSTPFADYARTHASTPAAFAPLLDDAIARQKAGLAPSAYSALQQLARERHLDLAAHFPDIRIEASLKNLERRNGLVLAELARRAKGRLPRGLDLAGGVAVTFEIDAGATAALDPGARREKLAKAIEILRKRVDTFGVAEPVIRPVGDNRIELQLPDVSLRDNPDLLAQIRKPARLDFRIVHPTLRPAAGVTAPFGYEPLALESEDAHGDVVSEELFVKRVPEFSGNLITAARAETDINGRSQVTLQLNSEGAVRFADVTGMLSANGTQTGRLAIVLDGKLQSAPLVSQEINSGAATISGGRMSDRDAISLANTLNNPLDLPLMVKEQHEVGPSLAQDAVDRGVRAAVIGTAAVVAFMVAFYSAGGVVAVLSLALNLLLIFGVMASIGATLTLPGLAGIVLTIGMAVDANILIFERVREELAAGAALEPANRSGYRHALATILDAHLVQLLICAIMIWLGHGPIRGFGVTLLIGVLSTLFSVLVTSHLLLEVLIESGWLRRLTFRRLLGELRVDFVRWGRPAFIASWLVVLLGIAVIGFKGNAIYGVDFTGGDAVSVRFAHAQPDDAALQRAAAAHGLASVRVVHTHLAGEGTAAGAMRQIETPEGKGGVLLAALQETFPAAGVEHLGTAQVGAALGHETQLNALLAVGAAMLTIFLYIALRFEIGFGIGAMVATLHDLLMTIGVFVLSGRHFDAPMVAAILCIAGYSINEAVVVFDRIREELKLAPAAPLREVVNSAVRKVFARTIMTASTTTLAALALFVFGGGVLRDISFTFLVGIGTSTFSAIFVAAQVFYAWHKGDRRGLEVDAAEIAGRRVWEKAL